MRRSRVAGKGWSHEQVGCTGPSYHTPVSRIVILPFIVAICPYHLKIAAFLVLDFIINSLGPMRYLLPRKRKEIMKNENSKRLFNHISR